MSKRPFVIFIFFVITLGLLAYFAHQRPHLPGDVRISSWIQGLDLPHLDPVMRAVSYISSFIPAIIIVTSVVIWLVVSGRKREALFIGSVTGLSYLLSLPLKSLVGRPRPTSELIQIMVTSNDNSFPSGHTLYSIAFYGFLFYLAPRVLRPAIVAKVLRLILVLLILLTATSRIYLGAHWFSDVFGGLLFGGLTLTITIVLYRHYVERRQKGGYKNAGASRSRDDKK